MRPTFNIKALVVFTWALILSTHTPKAQFSQARLQATGLTCALCSKAIHEALMQLPFVDSVRADIKSSAFDIQFKSDATVQVEVMRTAVEEAGFFVGALQLKLAKPFTEAERTGRAFNRESSTYRLLEAWRPGASLQVIGRGYMTEKDFKKIAARYADQLASDRTAIYLLPKSQ